MIDFPTGPLEGHATLSRIYMLARLVAAEAYGLASVDVSQLTEQQLIAIVDGIGDERLSERLDWGLAMTAVEEAMRHLRLDS